MLQYVAVLCSVLQRVTVSYSKISCWSEYTRESRVQVSVLQCVTVCCSVLQRVAACCSVLQCAAVCCSKTSFCSVYVVESWSHVSVLSVAVHTAVCCSALQSHTAKHHVGVSIHVSRERR